MKTTSYIKEARNKLPYIVWFHYKKKQSRQFYRENKIIGCQELREMGNDCLMDFFGVNEMFCN